MKSKHEIIEEFSLDNSREHYKKIWENFRQWSPEKKKEVLDALYEDNEWWFYEFLTTTRQECTPVEKEKAISRLMARLSFGLPYDYQKIRHILDTDSSLEELRENVFNTLSGEFDYSSDRRRCFQVARETRLEGKRLVCGRFSRAFYIDALLLANSAYISSQLLQEECASLQKMIPCRKELEPLLPSLERLEALLREKEVARARLIHALYQFRKALDDCEWSFIQKGYASGEKVNSSHRRTLEKVRRFLSRCLKKLLSLEGRCPVTMVFFQRISPSGSLNIATLNELRDPFFGEDEEIENLLALGGGEMYITPNMDDWLTQCDDWVEALPAYAAYEIEPTERNYQIKTRVEREALEVMIRSQAGNWKKNIENVMTTEFLHAGRVCLASKLNEHWKDKEELLQKLGENRVVAILAVLLEETYWQEIENITSLREQESFTRLQALLHVLSRQDEKSLIHDYFRHVSDAGENFEEGRAWLTTRGLEHRLEHFLSFLGEPLREMPSLHILTTLGPGETEYNVKNWLEESMLLESIIHSHNLKEKVQKKQEEWKDAVIAAARRIIAEGHLEAEVMKYGEDDESVLRFLRDHSEIGKKVARFCLLRLAEGCDMHKESIAVEEPRMVRDRLLQKGWADIKDEQERYLMLDESRQEAYFKLQDRQSEDEFFKQYLHPVHRQLHAQRRVIAEEGLMKEMVHPAHRYEADGPFKGYHLLYTPSRVDLGANEVSSVRDIPKWVGALDEEAANRAKHLYDLYNIGGPVIIPSTKVAEFLKVGENFFSRGGVYYLSLAAGVNIDTLGFGDFEFFRGEWNKRGDRLVLPGGETYGGFCVPKEFTLLYASILSVLDEDARRKFLASLGVANSFSQDLLKQLKTILSWKSRYDSLVQWEMDAYDYLLAQYEKLQGNDGPCYLFPLTKLALTLEKMGVLDTSPRYPLADWVNKKAQGLEEINRIGPYRKVRLIEDLLREARAGRENIASPEKTIGVMAAPYKEGEIKDGRSIPISDVRFSAGCRKLEIYAGVHEQHILHDIDFEGREIIKQLMKDFVSPADIRMVGSCTGSDILSYVPGANLEDIKNQVLEILLEWGIDEDLMETNSILFGGELRKWIGIKERSSEEQNRLLKEIEGRIHLLVVEKRGTLPTYAEALQGADFIDLGVPDPELLDLVDNMPKMITLMRRDRMNSALVFADGTSGARRPTFAFRYPDASFKVKELFALEPHARYGCLGIGSEQVESWRTMMEEERYFAKTWRDFLTNGDSADTQRLLEQYRAWVEKHRCTGLSREQEEKAREMGIWTPYFRLNARYFFSVADREVFPAQVDFGAWLLMGGRYLLNGKMSEEEFAVRREEYEKKRRELFGEDITSLFNSQEIDQIMALFLRPYYSGKKKKYATEVETGLAGSLKAVEEEVTQLARWEERKKELVLLREKNACRKKYRTVYDKLESLDVDGSFHRAKELLPSSAGDVSAGQKGEFFAAFIKTLEAVHTWKDIDLEQYIQRFAESLELPEEEYLELAGEIAGASDISQLKKEKVMLLPAVLELVDITFLLSSVTGVSSPEEMNNALAKFFDRTVNNHIFDYFPYHYHRQRSAYFEQLERQDKFRLAFQHHQWLYAHLHWLINNRTPLKEYSEKYRILYCGNVIKGKQAMGIIELNREESFWFHYARLRDIVVLYYERYGYPQLAVNVEPEVFTDNVKLTIVYPYGNTTVPVALEQGPILSEKYGADLFLCAFPRIINEDGSENLVMDEAMVCPSKSLRQKIEDRYALYGDKNGDFLFMSFHDPLPLDGIFFHFTHPLRMDVDRLKMPLIQPLAWEAASHLKCQLPAMLKNTGVGVPEQINWFASKTSEIEAGEAKERIRSDIHSLAKRHDTLILKPEKESGGRKILLRKMKREGEINQEVLGEMTEAAYQVSLTDNVVIQEVLPSCVRRLYDPEFLEMLIDRFARINIPVFLRREPLTPLYSYFRIVAVEGEKGLEFSHYMTVISTQGVANVGQGGLLFEYTDEIIHPRYRAELKRQLHDAAYNSWKGQKKYLQKNWRYAVEEYLKLYPEFRKKLPRYEELAQCGDFVPDDIPYEMGDYMPVFLINEEDRLCAVYDFKSQQRIPLLTPTGRRRNVEVYDASGQPVAWDENNLPEYYSAEGERIGLYNGHGEEIPPFVVYKIEPNPGAGLWRPHNDQLPPERKGEGVIKVFDCLAQRARRCKEGKSSEK